MKLYILLWIFLISVPLLAQVMEIDRKLESEQANLWKKTLAESRDKSTDDKFATLMLGLRNMGYRSSFEGHSDEIAMVFSDIQNEFLKVPNHAKYFQDKLEEARNKLPEGVRRHSGLHNDFEALRCRIIRDTMCHIPSPEIVKALGDYLDDERDTPPPNNWLDTRSNAYLACSALEKIGLKNAPLPPTAGENPDNLATWKLWWGPIEAGNRTFSFEGQDVEYRFRKDGTYETLSRDGTQKRIANGAAGEIENTPTKLGKPVQRWLILLGGCAALFAWLRWQSKHKKT